MSAPMGKAEVPALGHSGRLMTRCGSYRSQIDELTIYGIQRNTRTLALADRRITWH
jgi:hypothetical protein